MKQFKILNVLLLALCTTLPSFALPDLSVISVASSEDEVPPPGEGGILVEFVILNQGDAPSGPFWAEGYAAQAQSCSVTQDERPISRAQFPSLSPGQSIRGSYILTSTPGDERIFARVRADIFGSVNESNESNNCRGSFSKTVAYPDLDIESTRGPTPNKFIAGKPGADFEVSVENIQRTNGNWAAGPSTTGYYASLQTSNPPETDRLIELNSETPMLGIGDRAVVNITVEIPEGTPEGEYRLFAKADADKNVPEGSREDNNFSAGRSIEVVDVCTFADFNESGAVDILDLTAVVNDLGNFLYLRNYHLNIQTAHAPFPESINRLDLLEAVGCWNNRSVDGPGGTLHDIDVIPYAGEWAISAELSGSVVSIETMLVLPAGIEYGHWQTPFDLLDSNKVEMRVPGLLRDQIYTLNTFATYANISKAFSKNQYAAISFQTRQPFDPSQLEPLPADAPFTSGIAVQVVFADGSVEVLRKRFAYVHAPDPQFRSALKTALGIAQDQPIPLGRARMATILDLRNAGIQDVTGLEAFTNLRQLYLDGNTLREIPDLDGMTLLRRLDFSGNQVYKLHALPTGLEWLDVADNQLWDVDDITGLAQLTFLDISDNRITELPTLQGLAQLETMLANNANLTGIPTLPAGLRHLEAEANNLIAVPTFTGPLLTLRLRHNYIIDASSLIGPGLSPNTNEILLDHNNLDLRFCSVRDGVTKLTRGKIPTFTYTDQMVDSSNCISSVILQ
jgi:hypothetical protein